MMHLLYIGIRLLTGSGRLTTVDSSEARALSFNRDYIDIYTNSWGPGKYYDVDGPDEMAKRALQEGVTKVCSSAILYHYLDNHL